MKDQPFFKLPLMTDARRAELAKMDLGPGQVVSAELDRTTAHTLPADYLDLLQKVLTFSLWDGADGDYDMDRYNETWLRRGLKTVRRGLQQIWLGDEFYRRQRRDGTGWPVLAHTMVGERRLAQLRKCCEHALADNVPGDFVETGVWRGGCAILMCAVLKAWDDRERLVWACDSFQGLPEPTHPEDRGDRHHTFKPVAVALAKVKANFARYGLLDDRVRFLEGWFEHTLPALAKAGRPVAVLRVDCDMFSSTMDALVNLYPLLSTGGWCVVDDYHTVPACRRAVDVYRGQGWAHGTLCEIDGHGVYWRKA